MPPFNVQFVKSKLNVSVYLNRFLITGDVVLYVTSLNSPATDKEVNDLYNHPKVKAHVSFTKGEGFGRPLIEAALTGKPIITTNWSGHLDFLNADKLNLDLSPKIWVTVSDGDFLAIIEIIRRIYRMSWYLK